VTTNARMELAAQPLNEEGQTRYTGHEGKGFIVHLMSSRTFQTTF